MSRCSESFLENAPDARWGVARPTGIVSGPPSFIRPTCRMLDAYQFMPHLRIHSPRAVPCLVLSSTFLSLLPFRTSAYSPAPGRRPATAFPFGITYVLTIPGVTVFASQVNRFSRFLERAHHRIRKIQSLRSLKSKLITQSDAS